MEHLDVLIVGAGISGIDAAHHLQTDHPHRSYAILDARERIGGTWDLFRYPGVRSDSDMHTLGFPFRPWSAEVALGGGTAIREYVEDTARAEGIDDHIRFGTKVTAASWSSADQRWTVTATGPGGSRQLSAEFLYLCSGYYSYDQGYTPQIPGMDDFQGTVIHPQFWPEDLDYSGKRVAVIGSGATAVTLVPAMTDHAEHVTMVQRSPTYMLAMPNDDPVGRLLKRLLPRRLALRAIRAKNVLTATAFFQLCKRAPGVARKLLLGAATKAMDEKTVAEHFQPAYNPWEQRLCLIPDGDFYQAVRAGKASVTTGTIAAVTASGIRMDSGDEVDADIIVTATGLELLAGGGVALTVDGRQVDPADSYLYRGTLLSGVPNLAVWIGYVNASWTLRAELTSQLISRLHRHMDEHGSAVVMAEAPAGMPKRPLLDLTSGYIQRAAAALPKQGDRQPWLVRQNYLLDAATTRAARFDDLTFTARTASMVAQAS